MAVSNSVQLVHAAATVNDTGFAQYIAALDEDIRTWPSERQRVAIYVVPTAIGMNAQWREQQRRVLDERRQKLSDITLGFALVTSSAVVRGFFTAVLWLAQPPFPCTMTSTVPGGFRALRQHLPTLDVDDASQWYDACLSYGLGSV